MNLDEIDALIADTRTRLAPLEVPAEERDSTIKNLEVGQYPGDHPDTYLKSGRTEFEALKTSRQPIVEQVKKARTQEQQLRDQESVWGQIKAFGQNLIAPHEVVQPPVTKNGQIPQAKVTQTPPQSVTPSVQALSRPSQPVTTLNPDDEEAFQAWYADTAKKTGLNPNPDDPLHKYDMRAFWKSGQEPQPDPTDVDPRTGQPRLHFSSEFKHNDHPNRFVLENGKILDSKYGRLIEPGQFNQVATPEQKATVEQSMRTSGLLDETPSAQGPPLTQVPTPETVRPGLDPNAPQIRPNLRAAQLGMTPEQVFTATRSPLEKYVTEPFTEMGKSLVYRGPTEFFDWLDKKADQFSGATGIPKGGLFKQIADLARAKATEQPIDPAWSTQFLSELGKVPTRDLPKIAAFTSLLGPVVGFGVMGAVEGSERGSKQAMIEGFKGLMFGKAFQGIEGLGMGQRAVAGGTLFGSQAIAEGERDPGKIAGQAITGAMMVAPGPVAGETFRQRLQGYQDLPPRPSNVLEQIGLDPNTATLKDVRLAFRDKAQALKEATVSATTDDARMALTNQFQQLVRDFHEAETILGRERPMGAANAVAPPAQNPGRLQLTGSVQTPDAMVHPSPTKPSGSMRDAPFAAPPKPKPRVVPPSITGQPQVPMMPPRQPGVNLSAIPSELQVMTPAQRPPFLIPQPPPQAAPGMPPAMVPTSPERVPSSLQEAGGRPTTPLPPASSPGMENRVLAPVRQAILPEELVPGAAPMPPQAIQVTRIPVPTPEAMMTQPGPTVASAAPTVEDLHALADKRGIPWDNAPKFMDFTKAVTGQTHLDDLDAPQRQEFATALAQVNPAKLQPAKDVQTSSPAVPTPEQAVMPTVHPARATIKDTVATIAANLAKGEMLSPKGPSGDRIRTRDTYLQDLARTDPEQAKEIATDWKKDPNHFSDVSGVSPVMILQEAEILEQQLKTQPALTPETVTLPAKLPAVETPTDVAAHEAATSPTNALPEPTKAQKESGVFKKGHVTISGLNISIENPQGSTRSGVDKGGKPWSQVMQDHYGYFKGTVGKDKDHIDVWVKPGTPENYSGPVFVIDQNKPDTKIFDEHKTILGARDSKEARAIYTRNHALASTSLGGLSTFTMPQFKEWLKSGDHTKPAVNYRVPQDVGPPMMGSEVLSGVHQRAEEATRKLAEQKAVTPEMMQTKPGVTPEQVRLPESGSVKQKAPWQRTQKDLLGRVDRIDQAAANWDEEGFLGSKPKYIQEGGVIHRSKDVNLGYLFGEPNDAHVKAHHEFAIGRGIGKDDGRYFLLEKIVTENGRSSGFSPVGEYAGTGNGIAKAYQGYGAGRAFFKELMNRGIWEPESLGYSPGGLAAVKSAHKSIIQDALAAGKPVPANVRADYPELKSGVTPETISTPKQTLAVTPEQAVETVPPVVTKKPAVPLAKESKNTGLMFRSWDISTTIPDYPGRSESDHISKVQMVPITQIESTESVHKTQIESIRQAAQAGTPLPAIVAEFSSETPEGHDVLSVIDGHARLQYAKENGESSVPVRVMVQADDWAQVKAGGGMTINQPLVTTPEQGGEKVPPPVVAKAPAPVVEKKPPSRLMETASHLEEQANAKLAQDRNTNTAKRARQASQSEGEARADLALATTMKHLAGAIDRGEAPHLNEVRFKTQVELLNTLTTKAKRDELRKKYENYAEQERHVGEPVTEAILPSVKFPAWSMGASDARRYAVDDLPKVPGTKALSHELVNATGGQTDVVRLPQDLAERIYAKTSAYADSKGLKGYDRSKVIPWQLESAVKDITALRKMGIENSQDLRTALKEFIQFRSATKAADRATELERDLVGKKNVGIDFFPTPKGQAEKMVKAADIQPGMTVLEPSAGSGNIAEAIRKTGVEPDVAEISSSLRDILEAKKFNLVGQDFMDLKKDGYDRILMNPPFSNGQDAEHVRHAYELLKPGGRLVAIVGEGTFTGSNAKVTSFRNWLDQVHGTEEKLPAGTFTDKQLMATTGVNARQVVIEKPVEKQAAVALRAEAPHEVEQMRVSKHPETVTPDLAMAQAMPSVEQARSKRTPSSTPEPTPTPTAPAATPKSPTTTQSAKATAATVKDDLLTLLAPAARGEAGQKQASIMREHLAILAAKTERAREALKKASATFNKMPIPERYQFIQQMETGNSQPKPELNTIASTLRGIMDGRRQEIQALGTGKLDAFIENYFPHIWKDPVKATDAFAQAYGKRPLEGSKAFLKHRSIPTTQEGIALGLEPVSSNPVDLALLKVREMDRYLMGQHVLQEMKDQGLAKFVRFGQTAPDGWSKINDKIAKVWGNPNIPVEEAFDAGLMNQLKDFADSLGIDVGRKVKIGAGKEMKESWGYSSPTVPEIMTKFGGPETVLTHELGHQLDAKYGLAATFQANPTAWDELASLSELRAGGAQIAPDYHAYLLKPTERIANLIHAYVHAPALVEQEAPTAKRLLSSIIQEHPELAPLDTIAPTLQLGTGSATVHAGGGVIRGEYYAPEPASRVLNNYLSPGLQGKPLFDLFRGAGNVLNQAQLGLSAFHLGFVSVDAQVSQVALGIQELLAGKPASTLKHVALAPLAPFTTYFKGDKVLKEYFSPGSQGAEVAATVDALIKAGGRVKMDTFYHNSAVESFWNAIHEHQYGKATLQGFPAILEYASRPIMETLVPRMKLGVFSDLAQFELEQMPNNSTPEQGRLAVQRAWDSVDNRLGQVVYDNLFWHKTLKDVLMAGVRSVGWNLGTFRELGGGTLVDLPKQAMRAVKGDGFTMTSRMAYVLALPMVAALYGALYQYLATGQGPDELKDYFFPKTGRVRADGSEDRVSLPTYMKDIYAYEAHPLVTLGHKVNPAVSVGIDMLKNDDFYGAAIRNPDDPIVQQLLDVVKYAGDSFTPFGIRGLRQQLETGAPLAQAAQAFVGITPAPASMTREPEEVEAQERRLRGTSIAKKKLAEQKKGLQELVTKGPGYESKGLPPDPNRKDYGRWQNIESQWKEKLGKESGGASAPTARGQVLKQMGVAARQGDRDAVDTLWRAYQTEGGDKQSLHASLRMMAPLSGLSKVTKEYVMGNLTDEEMTTLKGAEEYYMNSLLAILPPGERGAFRAGLPSRLHPRKELPAKPSTPGFLSRTHEALGIAPHELAP